MSVKGGAFEEGELVSSTFWLPSLHATPIVQEHPETDELNRSVIASRHLRPGDWRRVAAAETDGTPVRPPEDVSYGNIDDVHSTISSIQNDDAKPFLGGEASFCLQSTPRASDEVGSDGELSTPGSGGYTSPSPEINFVLRPESIMQSNNPLFVDRPSPFVGKDDVARTLMLSPCADPSPESKPPRRTRDSVWSSDMSGGRSVSLNSLTHTLRTSDAAGTPSVTGVSLGRTTPEATPLASPVPFALRQQREEAPSPYTELTTPRRTIMALSGMQSGTVSGAPSVAAPSGSSKRPEAQTPCSAPLPAATNSKATGANPKGPSATPCSSAVEPVVLSPSLPRRTQSDKDCSHESGTAAAVASPSRGALLAASNHVDDTVGPRRGLDQTPRKSNRVYASDSGKAAKDVAESERGGERSGTIAAGSHAPPSVSGQAKGAGSKPQLAKESKRSGGGGLWRNVGSLAVVMVLAAAACFVVIGNMPEGAQRSLDAYMRPLITSMSAFGRGPLTQHREVPPLADTLHPAAMDSATNLTTPFRDAGAATTLPRLPFCWTGGMNSHWLDMLFQPASSGPVQEESPPATQVMEGDASSALNTDLGLQVQVEAPGSAANPPPSADAGRSSTSDLIRSNPAAVVDVALHSLTAAPEGTMEEQPAAADKAVESGEAVTVREDAVPQQPIATMTEDYPPIHFLLHESPQQSEVESQVLAVLENASQSPIQMAELPEVPEFPESALDEAVTPAASDWQSSTDVPSENVEDGFKPQGCELPDEELPLVEEERSARGPDAEQSEPEALGVPAGETPAAPPLGPVYAGELEELAGGFTAPLLEAASGDVSAAATLEMPTDQPSEDLEQGAAVLDADVVTEAPKQDADQQAVDEMSSVVDLAESPAAEDEAGHVMGLDLGGSDNSDAAPLTTVEAHESDALISMPSSVAAVQPEVIESDPVELRASAQMDGMELAADAEEPTVEQPVTEKSAAKAAATEQRQKQFPGAVLTTAGAAFVLAATLLALASAHRQPAVTPAHPTPAPATPATPAPVAQEAAVPEASPLTPSGRFLKLKGGFTYGGYGTPSRPSADDARESVADQAQRTPEPGSYVYIRNKLTYVEDLK